MNGPLGGRAFALEGSDDVQFGDAPSPANQINQVVVPPAPALASEAYGTELVEMYWASLLRDVAFSDYATESTGHQAAAELESMPTYSVRGIVRATSRPNCSSGAPIRAKPSGLTCSQFMLIPTFLGAQAISQQLQLYLAGQDLHDRCDHLPASAERYRHRAVVQIDPQLRYITDGRDIGTFTRVRTCFSRRTLSLSWCCATMGAPLQSRAIPMSARPNKMASAPSADPTSQRRSVPSPASR